MKRRLAVLITCFNRCQTTCASLQGLLNQELPSDVALDVFLVDDASPDGTASIVKGLFPSVHVFSGDGRLYWTGGTHLAEVHASQGDPDFFLWLNDDAVLFDRALMSLLEASASKDDQAIVVGSLRHPLRRETIYGGFRQVGGTSVPMNLKREGPGDSLKPIQTMNGNVVLIPRSAHTLIGNLDTRFRHNMADLDYGFRATAKGIEIVLAPGWSGSSTPNEDKLSWRNASVPLRKRWSDVVSFRGMPPKDWWTFTRLYGGKRWVVIFAKPYLRATFPRLANLLTGRRDA